MDAARGAEPADHQESARARHQLLRHANVYSDGSSEEIVGRALRDFAKREDYVLATKLNGRMRPGPNGAGLSRKAIFAELDASLGRLGVEYVDLYQIHRWDPHTPIEETLEALHDVVKAGKVRYLGASSMFAWQLAKALFTQERHGWSRFVSMQDHLNLLYREEEREVLPLCVDQKVGVIPWSPRARGRLARAAGTVTERAKTDPFSGTLYQATERQDQAILDVVERVATARGASRASVALDVTLASDDIAALEAPYVPHAIAGHA